MLGPVQRPAKYLTRYASPAHPSCENRATSFASASPCRGCGRLFTSLVDWVRHVARPVAYPSRSPLVPAAQGRALPAGVGLPQISSEIVFEILKSSLKPSMISFNICDHPRTPSKNAAHAALMRPLRRCFARPIDRVESPAVVHCDPLHVLSGAAGQSIILPCPVPKSRHQFWCPLVFYLGAKLCGVVRRVVRVKPV